MRLGVPGSTRRLLLRRGVTVAEACAAGGLDERDTLAALERALTTEQGPLREEPRAMATPELIAYIVSRDYEFRAALPFVGTLVAKVVGVHGEHIPRLVKMQDMFLELRELLDAHLDEEEEILFQHVTSIAEDPAVNARALAGARREHLEVGAALRRMRELADDFTAPAWACTSYRRLLSELQVLEDEVLRHVLVEHHVLFPRLAA